MAYIQLKGGAYQARTLIAGAQRCVNLYPEQTPDVEGEVTNYTHNLTPGLTLLSTAPQSPVRCLYRATSGDLYACAGQGIYYITTGWAWQLIGTITGTTPTSVLPKTTPVSMVDNTLDMIVVDGSSEGWTFSVVTKSGWKRIADPAFYGSNRVDYADTFFLAAKPNTPLFYCSLSEQVSFDPNDFVDKSAFGDNIQCVVAVKRVVWLIGKFSTELWYNSGGASSASSFPYEITSVFYEKGIAAIYSLAKIADNLFWLSQDAAGKGVIVGTNGSNINRISTHAIEAEISKYSTVSDAVAWSYQQQGHTFYVLTFPSADKSWCYDLTTGQWHERVWLDNGGVEHRHRANFAAFAYDTNVVGDWENGKLYALDPNAFTDVTSPIKRLRSFPHIMDTDSNRRVFYKQVIANMAVGTSSTSALSQQTELSADFNVADGTLLENAGENFTLLTPNVHGQILNKQMAPLSSGVLTAYQNTTVPTSPNYTVQFKVSQSFYGITPATGCQSWVIARANGLTKGYQAGVRSDGTNLLLFLDVLGTSITQSYAVQNVSFGNLIITLQLEGPAISVNLQRDQDGMWFDPVRGWIGDPVTAITLSDTTYTEPGTIIIGDGQA